MKTKHFILLGICITAVVLGFFFFKALRKYNEKAKKIERIPLVSLLTISGEEISLMEQKGGKKTAMLFFSPDCEYCKKEIEDIVANANSFEKTDWIFVTLASEEELQSFLLDYRLESIPCAKIVREEFPELYLALDVTAPPSLFIYDSDGCLEHHSRGAVPIDTIIDWLN